MSLFLSGCSNWQAPAVVMKLAAARGAQDLILSPSSTLLALAVSGEKGLSRGGVVVFDLSQKPPKARHYFLRGRPVSLAWKEGEEHLYVAGKDGLLQLLSLTQGRVLRSRQLKLAGVQTLSYDSENELLLLGSSQNENLAFIDAKDLRLLKRLKLGGSVRQIAAGNPGEVLVVTARADSLAKVRLIDRSLLSNGLAAYNPNGVAVATKQGVAWVSASGVTSGAKTLAKPRLIKMRLSDGRALDYIAMDAPATDVGLWQGGLIALSRPQGKAFFFEMDGSKIGEVELGQAPRGIAVDEKRGQAYVCLVKEGMVAVIRLPQKKH